MTNTPVGTIAAEVSIRREFRKTVKRRNLDWTCKADAYNTKVVDTVDVRLRWCKFLFSLIFALGILKVFELHYSDCEGELFVGVVLVR